MYVVGYSLGQISRSTINITYRHFITPASDRQIITLHFDPRSFGSALIGVREIPERAVAL